MELQTTNLHMIIGREGEEPMEDIVRDFKKFTSVHFVKAIEANQLESRKEWTLKIFAQTGSESDKHKKYKFW